MNSVVSSRVRLARNAADIPFPVRMKELQRRHMWQMACQILPENYEKIAVGKDTMTEMAMLAEQHWISTEMLSGGGTRGAAIDRANGVSVMVNEEDHFRIQSILPGLAPEDTLIRCTGAEQRLGGKLPYAFDDKYGYLTSCPTNLGAGLRVSVMLHLPAMTESGQIRQLIAELGKLGYMTRGFYGEGSDAAAGYYQISNQTSLGLTEDEIVKRLSGVIGSVAAKEDAVRGAMYENNRVQWEDRLWRAHGLLANARLMNFEEALTHLSYLRMGTPDDKKPLITARTIDALIAEIGPYALAYKAGQPLDARRRDEFRTEIIRKAITA